MLARCLRLLQRDRLETRAVVAFSDPSPPRCHRGTIYQAVGALAYGTSTRRRFYRDGEGRLRHPRQRGQNITLAEAAGRGWTPEWRAGKFRYLFLLGSRAARAAARQHLRVQLTPYPAGEPSPTLAQRLAAAAGWWNLPYPIRPLMGPRAAGPEPLMAGGRAGRPPPEHPAQAERPARGGFRNRAENPMRLL